jgi:hypothetical protein
VFLSDELLASESGELGVHVDDVLLELAPTVSGGPG